MEWQHRVADTLQRLSRGTISSLLQRGLEATLLYHHVVQRLQQDASHPVVVLGDMNTAGFDPVGSPDHAERVFTIGGLEQEQWPAGIHTWLYDRLQIPSG